MRFIEKFEENVRLCPDKVILRDSENTLTFRELDELSGRIYAYLKQKGVGREDMVMISLPHGIHPYATMIGVWKSGAALVASSPDLPHDRERFICNECHPKIIINQSVWQEILSTKPLQGHMSTAPHDACYIIYTSGSEGNPKGIVNEYGQIDMNAQTVPYGGITEFPEDSIEYIPIPFNFTGVILACTWNLYRRIAIDAGPLELMYNPSKLQKYLIDHKINIATFPPSFLTNNNIQSPYLKYIQIAMETAQNISPDDYYIANSYAQSEGRIISMFIVDKAYDMVPIGKPTDPTDIILVDDDYPVPTGGIGELCYRNPYFRGYINDEERTRNSFIDGYFRSGDIARINEDGNYVILGRKTDMIKINGNRIEPAEIEAAVKRVLGIDWVFAKGFVQPERSFICVYYTADIEIDYAKVREALLKILPTYMMPSYFIHIDSIPHLPNGKIDRKAFLAPELDTYFTEYTAPTNELEERLCETMQEVLGLERLGINDDFYLLGGDSLRTIKLVSLLDIQGISVPDIYEARTPAAIAERWLLKQLEN